MFRWVVNRRGRRGIFYYGCEYSVSISEINIPEELLTRKITSQRFKREENYWRGTGLYETRVLLDRNFNLIDGYITILIARVNGETRVPAHFIDLHGREKIDEVN